MRERTAKYRTDKFCEGCVLGKQARTSFPREARYRAKKPLELIHTDICGPITPMSLGGHRYFRTFIDDYSRITWVYFLKEKSEVRASAMEESSPLFFGCKAIASYPTALKSFS